MTDLELSRALRHLRRTVLMLRTELRHGRVDTGLLADIESQLEQGVASEPRCAPLVRAVDALRESTLTPRAELLADTIRCCDKLADDIEGVTAVLA